MCTCDKHGVTFYTKYNMYNTGYMYMITYGKCIKSSKRNGFKTKTYYKYLKVSEEKEVKAFTPYCQILTKGASHNVKEYEPLQ